MTRISIAIMGLLAAGSASAHPDHLGSNTFAIEHFLSDPFHLAMTLGAVGLALVLRRSIRRRRTLR